MTTWTALAVAVRFDAEAKSASIVNAMGVGRWAWQRGPARLGRHSWGAIKHCRSDAALRWALKQDRRERARARGGRP